MSLALKDPDRRAAILNSDLQKINSWAKRWKVLMKKTKKKTRKNTTELLTFKKDNHPVYPVIWKYCSRRQGMSQTLRSDFSK